MISEEHGASVGVLLMALYTDASEEAKCLRSLAELKQLCETALGDEGENASFFCVTQCRRTPEAATLMGAGKVKEAAELCAREHLTLAVMDDELSPSQIRNIEDILNESSDAKVRVLDRTMLILDIFASHAVTGEGKLQVEIAQLKYTSPRLTGKGLQLSRQGGTSGAVGARGPGETKLETDRRHIEHRIQALREELEVLSKERDVKRARRTKSGIPTAAICGYTNAGKSTLLNTLTDAGILAENKLFATLDPTVRSLTLPSGRELLLSDTVGFINRLPHGLIDAFRSTLDEVRYADMLLIVIDASDTDASEKTDVTEKLLIELDAVGKPTLYIFNKCDSLSVIPPKSVMEQHDAVAISAKDGTNIDLLLQKIDEMLAAAKQRVTFLFPFSESAAVDALYRTASVENVEYVPEGTRVTALVTEKETGRYRQFIEQQ